MARYDFRAVEERWRPVWERLALDRTAVDPKRKFYVLVMFAYPSGDIHMGHFRNYTIGDAAARYRRMAGFEVLHPFGWDAFGMPAEAAAIKHSQHPREWTLGNLSRGRKTLQQMAISYDWEREVITCNPDYYKWTQWLFLLLHERGLAYQAPSTVNWCETCKTILANEQAQGGVCWRCEGRVVVKELENCWFFKYSEYAETLLRDLDKLPHWPENVKTMQRNWIGRSEGAEIEFEIEGGERFRVFTTRADTVYGVTFMAVAPEHPLARKLARGTPQERTVEEYIQAAARRTHEERMAEGEKDGVWSGRYAKNLLSGERVPIWVADYVIAAYGTGIVMAVPAHDTRDFRFAKKYGLPIRLVIQPPGGPIDVAAMPDAYVEAGIMVNSGPFSGQESTAGARAVAEHLAERRLGGPKVQYRLKDWLISRQRYWGCPIPIVHCERCGPVAEPNLPVLLPEGDISLIPKARSPLADVPSYIETKCPKCRRPARRDPDTMDTFMCSSFYLFRYLDAKNDRAPWDKGEAKKWLPVDLYIGGVEHACMHLLYFRFITKVLHDAGWLPVDEPVVRLFNHGMVLDERGDIMSKSKGNVVSPAEILGEWGVDVCRTAMFFAAPSDAEVRWSEQGLVGAQRFVGRFWEFVEGHAATVRAQSLGGRTPALPVTRSQLAEAVKTIRDRDEPGKMKDVLVDLGYTTREKLELETMRQKVRHDLLPEPWRAVRRKLHQTIRKFTEEFETGFRFNTALAAMMELLNTAKEREPLEPKDENQAAALVELLEDMVRMMAPLTPFVAEELWGALGREASVLSAWWPVADPEVAKEEEIELGVQVNGKLRARITVAPGAGEEEVRAKALAAVAAHLGGKPPRKMIVVAGKLVSVVV